MKFLRHVCTVPQATDEHCDIAGYLTVLTQAGQVLLRGQTSAWTLAGVGAAYLGMVIASIYVTAMELRLPLIHHRARIFQV